MRRGILILSAALFILPAAAKAQLPEANSIIVEYVASVIGKKVDRGECWDLANVALGKANAKWDGKFVFGREVYPVKDTIWPGDIIHFKRVVLKYRDGNDLITEQYPQHAAVVYRVVATGEYEIAHQNTNFSGRKVGLSTIRLRDKKSGTWHFYRPVL